MSTDEINISEVIGDWFDRRVQDAKDHFENYDINRAKLTHNVTLILIMIIAFLVRIYPLYLGWEPQIKAFDPWMQLRAADYIIHNGFWEFLVWWDPYRWYPYTISTGPSLYIGVPTAIVTVYKVLTFLGFHVTLKVAAYFVPVIFGTLGVLYTYLLGKELISSRAGLFAALIMSVTPAYVSRSIAGFTDNESVGVLFIVMTLYYFTKAFSRDSTKNAIFAGLSMFLLGGSWGAFRFAYDLFPVVGLMFILTGKFTPRFLKAYVITLSVSTLLMMLVPRVGGQFMESTEGLAPLAFIIVMVLYGLLKEYAKNLSTDSFRRFIVVGFTATIVIVAGLYILLISIGSISTVASKFISIIIPTKRNSLPLIDSVSEHLPLAWGGLYSNLSTLVFFIPLGIFFAIKQNTEKSVFVLAFGLTTIYFSGSMVRLMLLLAPAAAILSAMAIDNLLLPYAFAAHERIQITKSTSSLPSIGGQHAAASYSVVFVLILIMLSSGVATAGTKFSSPEITPGTSPDNALGDWLEAFEWMKTHSSYNLYANATANEKPPVMLSWWDYGNYISENGQTITLVDNATTNSTQIGVVGTMLMWNETAAINLMYMYNIQYVLVVPAGGQLGLGSDIGKSIWMIRIAEKNAAQFGVKESDYFSAKAGGGYQGPYFDSVLWKLMAYHAPDMPEDSGNGRPPFYTGQGSSSLESLVDFRNNVVNPGDLLYFKEVFRSTGIATNKGGEYPFIRIYQVQYPHDIEQRVNDFRETMGYV